MTGFFPARWSAAGRLAALLMSLAVLLDAGASLAQSSTCVQLNTMLQSLDRNAGLANADRAAQDLAALQANERNAERAYIRSGCQADQQQGLRQTPQCRSLARQILSQRDQIGQLQQSAGNAYALAQQRQQVVQQMSRYGCAQQGSGATFSGGRQPQRRTFLQDLFGNIQGQDGYGDDYYGGQESIQDPYANMPSGYTIRTVCVRLSDGYYWPISYSTTRDYIGQDQATCVSECPNQQVDLYYYDNPGQEPEQMVNAMGEAYTALPSAFAYRKQFDPANSCQPQETLGKITLEDDGSAHSRAIVTFGDQKFPLPMRDPRQTETATAAPAKVASVIDIPLPRPRPTMTDAGPKVPPTAEPVVSAKSRIVKVGDKIVRVVGPQTPYAPATSETDGGDAG
jgi:hypothetical protein